MIEIPECLLDDQARAARQINNAFVDGAEALGRVAVCTSMTKECGPDGHYFSTAVTDCTTGDLATLTGHLLANYLKTASEPIASPHDLMMMLGQINSYVMALLGISLGPHRIDNGSEAAE